MSEERTSATLVRCSGDPGSNVERQVGVSLVNR